MGAPRFAPVDIPLATNGQQDQYELETTTGSEIVQCVSMGNPHAVLRVEDVDSAPVESLGPELESHPAFPKRANIGFMQIVSSSEINLRVFERGVGETLACGTGACAAVVSGIRSGDLERSVTVNLRGGSLRIDWLDDDQSVILSGPAKTVFHGQIRI